MFVILVMVPMYSYAEVLDNDDDAEDKLLAYNLFSPAVKTFLYHKPQGGASVEFRENLIGVCLHSSSEDHECCTDMTIAMFSNDEEETENLCPLFNSSSHLLSPSLPLPESESLLSVWA